MYLCCKGKNMVHYYSLKVLMCTKRVQETKFNICYIKIIRLTVILNIIFSYCAPFITETIESTVK